MLGRQHLTLSAASMIPVLIPFSLEAPGLTLMVFLGVLVGSLIPDVDAQDAAIFHADIKGLNSGFGEALNDLVGPALPVFGYATRYLILAPGIKLLNFSTPYSFRGTHRSFTHTLVGAAFITAATGLYAFLILRIGGVPTPRLVLLFLLGYFTGMLLHIFQDGLTETGVRPLKPFRDTAIRGGLITGRDFRKPWIQLYVLAALSAASLGLTSKLGALEAFACSLAATGLSWMVFAGFCGFEVG